jgi:hypothetical protein
VPGRQHTFLRWPEVEGLVAEMHKVLRQRPPNRCCFPLLAGPCRWRRLGLLPRPPAGEAAWASRRSRGGRGDGRGHGPVARRHCTFLCFRCHNFRVAEGSKKQPLPGRGTGSLRTKPLRQPGPGGKQAPHADQAH